MAYGTLAVDYITYTFNSNDATATVSSVVNGQFPSITTTGTLSGATVTGTSGQFTTVTAVTGIFTTTLSGATVTGTTGNFTTLNASSIPGFAVLSGAQSFSGGQRGQVSVVSFATGIALDFATSNNFQITLTGNTTLQNPTNVVSGQAGIVTIIQGTGGNTMAFGSNWNYPGGSGSVPVLTTTSGARDVLAYYSISPTQIAYRLVQDIKA